MKRDRAFLLFKRSDRRTVCFFRAVFCFEWSTLSQAFSKRSYRETNGRGPETAARRELREEMRLETPDLVCPGARPVVPDPGGNESVFLIELVGPHYFWCSTL